MIYKQFEKYIKSKYFHAANFKYKDINCSLFGWWCLAIGDIFFEFEDKDKFFELKVFDGKSIKEAFDYIDIDECDIELICSNVYTCYFVQLKYATDIDFCYLYEGSNINIGDVVKVPFGSDDIITEGRVVGIETYDEDELPYPLAKMKYITNEPLKTKNTERDVYEFEEYSEVRIKGTNIVGTICDKSWNKELKKYLYIIDWTDSDGDYHTTFSLLSDEIENISQN